MFNSNFSFLGICFHSKKVILFFTFLCSIIFTKNYGAVNMSPITGPTSGMINITLTATAGENFGTVGTLTFSNVVVPGTEIVSWSNNKIIFKCPAGIGTNHQVVVTSNGNAFPAAQLFNYQTPVLTGISPNTGPQTGNTAVTLTGENFGNSSGPVTVMVGGLPGNNATWVNPTTITFNTPAGYGQDVNVTVTIAGQSSNALAFNYTTTGSVGIGTNNPNNFLSVGGNTNIMGRLGIGTTSPSTKLHVTGKIRMEDGSQGLGKVLTSDAQGLASWKDLSGSDILSNPLQQQLSCPDSIATIATDNNPLSMAIVGNYAYVVNNGSNSLQVFNISNPSSPSLTAMVATGNLPRSIVASGNYIYIVNYYDDNMQVFDISNPAMPTLISSIITGDAPISIKVSGNYAYVINYNSKNLVTINISNPASPSITGTVNTNNAHPYKLAVAGNNAYIISDPTITISIFFQIINISNPASPVIVGSTNVPVNVFSLEASGNFVYMFHPSGFVTYNIANPASPTLLGINDDFLYSESIVVNEDFIYTTPKLPDRIAVFNKNEAALPSIVNEIYLPTIAKAMAVAGDYAYVLMGNNLSIYDLVCDENQQVTIDPITGDTKAVPLQWKISGANIINANAGNVGIGEFNPLNKLAVGGNANITGNLGIGTSTPANKLSVSGNVDVTGNLGIGISNTFNKFEVSGSGGIKVSTTNTGSNAIDWIAGNFGGQGTERVVLGNLSGKAAIGGHNDELNTWTDFIVNPGGGNVGIGTSTPMAKLDVDGTTRTTQFQMTNGASANKVMQSDALGNASWVDATTLTITETDPQVGGNTTNYLSKWDGNSLVTSGVIDNGTNVGIGTTTPVAKLDVEGTTRTTQFQMTNGAGVSKILQSDAAGNGSWVDATTLTVTETDPQVGSNTTNFLSKWNGTSLVTSGVFDNGTNVGIGTSTPSRKLEVKGDIALGSWLENIPNRRIGVMDASLHVAGMEIENTTLSGNYSQKLHLLTHQFANGFGRRLTINEMGRVGIGTETPVNKLDVEGALAIGNTYSGTSTAPANGAIIEGSVGIGTNNPTTKLHVEGKIRIVDGTQAIGTILVGDANGVGSWIPFPTETDPQVSMSDNHAVPRWSSVNGTLEAGGIYNTDTGVGIGINNPTAALQVNGNVIIGNQGTVVNNIIKVNYTMPAPITITANNSHTIAFSVPNASIGSTVFVSPQNAIPEFVIISFGRVSSAGNVDIRLLNVGSSSATVSVNTFNVTIIE